MRDSLVNSRTVALLCRDLPLDEAADLIDDYARLVAAEASLEAKREAYAHTFKLLGTKLLIAAAA